MPIVVGVLRDVIIKNNLTVPTLQDVTDARTSLIRLQKVYKFDVYDMFRGDYNGYVGSELSVEDAYLVSG